MFIKSIKDIIEISKKENIDFFEVMLNSDIEERRISKEESFNQMKNIYNEMKKSVNNYDMSIWSVRSADRRISGRTNRSTRSS